VLVRQLVLVLFIAACAEASSPAPEGGPAPVASPVEASLSVQPPAVAPVVLHRDGAPILRNAPGTATVVALARGEGAFLGVLTLEPGARVPEHRDQTEEYLYVLRGGGQITIDGVVAELRSGVAVLMPAGAAVSYVNGPEVTEVVQVFAGPSPADKYEAWAPISGAP
jgi:quercetin dioxygenase-like cupin family protein